MKDFQIDIRTLVQAPSLPFQYIAGIYEEPPLAKKRLKYSTIHYIKSIKSIESIHNKHYPAIDFQDLIHI